MKNDLHVPLDTWLATREPNASRNGWVGSPPPETSIATNGTRNSASDISSQTPYRPRTAQGKSRLNIVDQGGTNVATWNVLTLNQPGSKLLLAKELKKYKVTIAGVTETHLPGHGEEDIGEGRTLLWSGGSQRRGGVGLVLNSAARRALLSFKPVSPRLLTARLDGKHGKITVITCYAPTNDADEEDKDDFYNLLSSELSSVPPHDYLLLLGDLNASVSNESGLWDLAVGPVTVDSLNDNGERLLNCCLAHNLTIANTWFQRPNIAKYTWYSNDGSTKKMLDYIILRRRWLSSVQNCRTYRGAELGNTDHRLVAAKIKLRLKAMKNSQSSRKIDAGRIQQDPALAERYHVEISNRFEVLGQCDDSEVAWKSFKENTLAAATDVVGMRQRKKKDWISNHSLAIIELRREARLGGDMATYRLLNKERNSMLHKDRKAFIDSKASELQEAAKKKDSGATYKILRELSGQHTQTTPYLRSASGENIYDQSQCLRQWEDHFEKLLNSDPPDQTDHELAAAAATTIPAPDGPEFTAEEIKAATRKLKNNKAPGICGLTSEFLKNGGPAMILWLQMLFNLVWHSEKIPSDWKKGLLVPIYKRKGSKAECINYRGITLLSVPGKLFAMLLLKRATRYLHALRRPQQAGFMPGRSTTEQIHTIRQLVEKTLEYKRKAYIAFVDFRSAFDTVDRQSLWLILQSAGVPTKIVRLLKELYNNTESAVIVNGRPSGYFKIKNGVRQGCAAAPELFNCVIDHILNKTQQVQPFGIGFAGRVLSDVDFADDVALICENISDLKTTLETLASAAEKFGLKINWSKTKIMPVEKTPSNPLSSVEICGQTVEVVKQFTYLGSIVCSNGSLDAEISARAAKANSVFGRLLKTVFHKPQISRLTKARIYSASVASVMLYSAETWSLTQTQTLKVDAIQTKHLRKIERSRWPDRVRNSEILRSFKLPPLSEQLESRSLRWYGHLLRLPAQTPARLIFDFDPAANGWRRPRGRPRTRWADVIRDRLASRNINPAEVTTLALNRPLWRRLTALTTGSLYAGDAAEQEL